MKITQVEPIHLRLPVVTGACDGTQDSLIILVHTDEGITGIGEVDSSPTVIKAIVEAPRSHQICTGLADLLIGENPLDIGRLWNRMYEGTIYYGRFGPVIHAISGVDIALWDIAGKVHGQPVHRLLGGAYRDKVRAYASVLFGDTPEETMRLGERLVGLGFTAVKFGWGPFGREEKLDKELASSARGGIGPDADLMIDVGCCWDWKTALRREEILRRFSPFWLEEPLAPDDLEGYRLLAERCQTRIAAGEEESGVPALERLIRQGGIDVVQPDVTRCGGLTAAMRVADIAASCKRMVANHTFKSGISIAASLHFVAAIPNAIAFEYCMAESALRHETTKQTFPVVDGFVEIPQEPGLGVELNMKTIQKYRQE
jgi:L-rhamnonate dehydratase